MDSHGLLDLVLLYKGLTLTTQLRTSEGISGDVAADQSGGSSWGNNWEHHSSSTR
jgi:hypothetical protein